MAAIYVEIIDNFYLIVHDRRRLDLSQWKFILREIRTSIGAKDRAELIKLSQSEQAVQIGARRAEHNRIYQS